MFVWSVHPFLHSAPVCQHADHATCDVRSKRPHLRTACVGLLTLQPLKNLNLKNSRWLTAAILKTVKSSYLCNRLIDFNEIWHNDAYSTCTADRPLKFPIWGKSKMAATMLKITKIAIFPQRFDRFLRNLVRWCKMGLLTAPTVKNLNFKNPRWRTDTILKTVKSPYLCNLLTDFDEIWHSDACWSPAPDVKFKFLIFDNHIRRRAAILRIEKLLKCIL